jgi:hypothetical protein
VEVCESASGFSARVNHEGESSESCRGFMVEFTGGFIKAKANRHGKACLGREDHGFKIFLDQEDSYIGRDAGLEILVGTVTAGTDTGRVCFLVWVLGVLFF